MDNMLNHVLGTLGLTSTGFTTDRNTLCRFIGQHAVIGCGRYPENVWWQVQALGHVRVFDMVLFKHQNVCYYQKSVKLF